MDKPLPVLRKKPSLSARLANAFKPKAGRKLSKAPSQNFLPVIEKVYSQSSTLKQPQEAAIEQSPVKTGPVNFYNKKTTTINAQTGELWDEAEMLHSMLRRDSADSVDSLNAREFRDRQAHDPSRKPGEAMITRLPAPIWEIIKDYLNPTDAANLTISNKSLLSLIGGRPFGALNINENHQFKIDFLLPMDRYLPNHLLCFPCAVYHLRTQKGKERIKANDVLNPVYNCPNNKLQSRHRLTPHHGLPFTFVQLLTRAEKYGPQYGINLEALDRRFRSRDSEWAHQTRYFMHRGHVLLRVVSRCFATGGLPPAGLRHFLYSRENYTPYFSVCDHWRDGELMNVCKCALSHVPPPKVSVVQQLHDKKGVNLALANPKMYVTLCSICRPMRRCPECPTEYLVEMKLEEDRRDPDPIGRFKQCMIVTRWSDLGDGRDPGKREWAAVNGVEGATYDSFGEVGRRAISGIFESQSGVTGPGQRILNLNPKGEKKGEAGHNWY